MERKPGSDLAFRINDVEVSEDELLRLHDLLFKEKSGQFCPGCRNPADMCQPVAELPAGKYEVGMRVRPRSYQDPNMFVEVMQLMLVGDQRNTRAGFIKG